MSRKGPKNVHGWVSDDFLTPPEMVRALGPFDIDPSASLGQPWRTAEVQWTVADDGLSKEWPRDKFVWLNCPYRGGIGEWMQRLADHGRGLALVFARTDTKWAHRAIWPRADAVFFLANRVFFHLPGTGERARCNGGAPSMIVGYSAEAVRRLERLTGPGSPYPGRLVRLRGPDPSAPAKSNRRGKVRA